MRFSLLTAKFPRFFRISQVEKNIAVMVSDGTLYAKVDRPANLVTFAKRKVNE
jgi:hypothetical protein